MLCPRNLTVDALNEQVLATLPAFDAEGVSQQSRFEATDTIATDMPDDTGLLREETPSPSPSGSRIWLPAGSGEGGGVS